MIHFTCHCRTQGSGETVTGAVTINDVSLGRAAPFRHACGKDLCTGQFRPAVQIVKSVDIVAFPEILFELVRCLLGARQFEGEAQDDSPGPDAGKQQSRSEEHTSELQSLMRISYAVFCLKKKKQSTTLTQAQVLHL